jgi:glutamate-5-semialdehyde dehydrogenase
MRKGEDDGLDAALLDRLSLSDARIDSMIEGLRQVVSLADPVGEISEMEYAGGFTTDLRSGDQYRGS